MSTKSDREGLSLGYRILYRIKYFGWASTALPSSVSTTTRT